MPWLGWKAFFVANLDPGNGGPLLQPKNQTSVFYSIPPSPQSVSNGKEEENSARNASSSVVASLDSINTANTTNGGEDKGIQPPR